MKKRPFFRQSIYQIEEVLKNRNSSEDISDIVYELSFRKTDRAKALLKKLNKKINKKNDQIKKVLEPQKPNDNFYKFIIIGLLLVIALRIFEIL